MTDASSMHVVIIVQIGPRLVGLLADRVLDIVSFEVDVSVTFRRLVSDTLSPICASVTAGTWFIANDAPTPT